MIDQFFCKTFYLSLCALFVLFLISLFSYFFSGSLFFMIAIALITISVCAYNPTFGLLGVFLELFSSPHGHLISTELFSFDVSLRMTVFIGFFIGYIFFLLRTKQKLSISSKNYFPFLILAVAIAIGFIFGFLSNHAVNVFKDGNAYFYLLYVFPILSINWDSKAKRQILQVFTAGAVWNILLSFLILYFFTHVSEPLIKVSYIFLRDIRLAEITNLGGSLYRVFIQTQFFSLVFGAFILALIPKIQSRRETIQATVLLSAVFATLILSLSRSFWIGIIFALFVLVFFLYRYYKKEIRLKSYLICLLSSVVLSVLLIVTIVLFPFPTQRVGGSDLSDLFVKRFTQNDDVAISSRWKLLDPMLQTISINPVIGNGFGKEVTFETDDPRARDIRSDGKWSTYAMEWGWMELWLKMGILGPVGFLFLFVYINKRLMTLMKSEHSWISIGLICGLFFLFATHIFSPYLNHPIGLGFILFTIIFIPKESESFAIQKSFQSNPSVQQEMPLPASALSLRAEE